MKKNLLKEQYARLFKGRPMSNDAKLINEAAVVVAAHDDKRQDEGDGFGASGEVTFKGTYDGFEWTASKDFQMDGSIYTSIYDTQGETVEDDMDAYDEINDAIGEYMEKKRIAAE
tara:strand:- start:324 stop:668 length:345 start_codon:yes stop_codon:yes gene_type:complete